MSSKSLKNSLIGASCVAAIGLGAYYLYMKSFNSGSAANKNVKNISKVKTIKVLKQLKKEFFSAFSTMSMLAQ